MNTKIRWSHYNKDTFSVRFNGKLRYKGYNKAIALQVYEDLLRTEREQYTHYSLYVHKNGTFYKGSSCPCYEKSKKIKHEFYGT